MVKFHGYDIGTFGNEKDGVDGFYGPQTEGAVRAFKHVYHLDENNGIDNSTWEYLIKTSEKGNCGLQVKALQAQLNYQIKVALPLSGQFDAATENAVRRFQQMNHLLATGKADLDVWCLLLGGTIYQQR